MARGILAVLSIALTVFALADCVQTQDDKVRGVPKWAWIVLIVLIPWVGPLTWLFVGKERSWGRGSSGSPGPRRDGPLAPDEDPEFLRKLDEDIRRERRERRERGEGPDDSGDSGELDDGPGDSGTDTGRSA
ncbi:PLD nuclease N-terminal domain-containing protein [Brachybacterium paraconglomeratum]|uniref:PLD nuclease N-terminal domain-containing protein n=1 Tax=Brachybacterium TaxID=43668 RepID=UPI0032427743